MFIIPENDRGQLNRWAKEEAIQNNKWMKDKGAILDREVIQGRGVILKGINIHIKWMTNRLLITEKEAVGV